MWKVMLEKSGIEWVCVGSVTKQTHKGARMKGLEAASTRWDGPNACEGREPTRQWAGPDFDRSTLSVIFYHQHHQ